MLSRRAVNVALAGATARYSANPARSCASVVSTASSCTRVAARSAPIATQALAVRDTCGSGVTLPGARCVRSSLAAAHSTSMVATPLCPSWRVCQATRRLAATVWRRLLGWAWTVPLRVRLRPLARSAESCGSRRAVAHASPRSTPAPRAQPRDLPPSRMCAPRACLLPLLPHHVPGLQAHLRHSAHKCGTRGWKA